MARTFASLKAQVWEPGSEFRLLPIDAQWAYTMLISQPQISNLGILPLAPRKWLRLADDATLERVEAALAVLEEREFILVDHETGELLVRTFIRHDKVYAQPALVTNARILIGQVESDRLRGYLVDKHPWLDADRWLAESPSFPNPKDRWREWDGPKIATHEEATERRPRARREGSLEVAPPPQDAGLGSGPGLSSREDEEHQPVASFATTTIEDPAAADLEAPREAEIVQVVDSLADKDPGTLARVELLARQLPACVFRATVDRHRARCATGTIINRTGLLVDLLKVAVRGYRAAEFATAATDGHTPRDQVLADARYYATRDFDMPWDAAEPLLRRKLTRLHVPDDELVEILDLAFDAFTEAGRAPAERSAA